MWSLGESLLLLYLRGSQILRTFGDIFLTHLYVWLLFHYRTRAESLMALCANVVCLLSVMLQPYMPAVSQQIQEQLQVDKLLLWTFAWILSCLMLCSQAPPMCNVLTETFVPHILPGHKIGQVLLIHLSIWLCLYGCIISPANIISNSWWTTNWWCWHFQNADKLQPVAVEKAFKHLHLAYLAAVATKINLSSLITCYPCKLDY